MLPEPFLLLLIVIGHCAAANCPINCVCLSDTDGRCSITVQSTVCLLKWGRLFLNINDWSLIDADTFSMCRSLHYVYITGEIRLLKADLLRFPSRNITDMYIQNTQIRSIDNRSLEYFSTAKNVIITSNRRLTTLSERAFFNLRQMYLLDLSFNNISDISRPFNVDLDNLRILKLSNNRIMSLPRDCLKNLRQLRVLELQRNLIAVIEAFGLRGLWSLVSLNLDHNLLSVVSHPELMEMTSLSKVDLSYNHLGGFVLPSCNDGLKVVNLAHNNLSSAPSINRQRCLGLLKVAIKGNPIKECSEKRPKSVFDLNVCEDELIGGSERVCAHKGSSFLAAYVVLIVLALLVLAVVSCVLFVVCRRRGAAPASGDLSGPKKPSKRWFQISWKRRSSDNTDDVFI